MTSNGFYIHMYNLSSNLPHRYNFINALGEKMQSINAKFQNRRKLAFKLICLATMIEEPHAISQWLRLPTDIQKYILNMLLDYSEYATSFGVSKQHMNSCTSLFLSDRNLIRSEIKKAHATNQTLVVTTSNSGRLARLTLKK